VIRADHRCCLGGQYPADKFQCIIERGMEMAGRKLRANPLTAEMPAVRERPECAGKSILELITEELDAVVERLMADAESKDGRDRGRAEGIGIALAILTNPYHPSLDAIREQTMVRWENRGGR
jgi:hypothetical protein